MTKRWIITGTATGLIVLAILAAACSPEQRAVLQTVAVATGAQAAPETGAAATPEFSLLVTPTAPPTMAGPMGTLTAIADLVASPTQDAEPYVIEQRGNPHFIEFHAWW